MPKGKIDYSNVKPVKALVGGKLYFFRSKWERDFALLLQWFLGAGWIKSWRYEPKRFHFPVPKRNKSRAYVPDFEVTLNNGKVLYYEVKGRMHPLSGAHLENMERFYPKVLLIEIREKEMQKVWKFLQKLRT